MGHRILTCRHLLLGRWGQRRPTRRRAFWARSVLTNRSRRITARKTDLSHYLTPAVQQGKVPGMVAAIIDENGVQAIGAAGVRKQGSPDPFKVDDLVHLGSNTKAMTSTMLATLVKDGTFANGWETTIGDVFPELLEKMHEDYHSVALSELIRMRGGIASNAEDWWAYQHNPDTAKRRYAILRDNLANAPTVTAGEYLYSNLSYVVAGAMAEKLTGKSWETLMEERLFTPLGITTAGFGPPGTPGELDQPWGHLPDGTGGRVPNQYGNNPALGPAGTVHISVEDWAKFISLWFVNKEPSILDRTMLNELVMPTGDYAAGWQITTRSWANGMVLTHAGTNTYWRSMLWIAPSRGFAFLAVANISDFHIELGVDNALDSIIFTLIQNSEQLTANTAGGVGGTLEIEQDEEEREVQQRLDPATVRSVTGAEPPTFLDEEVGFTLSRFEGYRQFVDCKRPSCPRQRRHSLSRPDHVSRCRVCVKHRRTNADALHHAREFRGSGVHL